MQTIYPDHPYVLILGHMDKSNSKAPALLFPGVTIRVRFKGTYLAAWFQNEGNHQIEDSNTYFTVTIDNASPKVLKTSADLKKYILFKNLDHSVHTVEIFKRSETNPFSSTNPFKSIFHGIELNETASLLPPPTKPYCIEFIGDSITCGYGNEINTFQPENHPMESVDSNGYNAWGAIAARSLNAEYQIFACSGKGVVRNFDDAQGPTIPQMYTDKVLNDGDSQTKFKQFSTPDAIVVNLGTNDYSKGLSSIRVPEMRQRFKRKYETFIMRLKGAYPKASIVLTVGPMVTNRRPKSLNARTLLQTDVYNIATTCTQNGMINVFYLDLGQQEGPYGAKWHPTIKTHQQIAAKLVTFIRNKHLLPIVKPMDDEIQMDLCS